MTSNWQEDFDRVSKQPPADSSILKTVDGTAVKVVIELLEGKEPFMYALIYVPTLVGSDVGWFARSVNDKSMFGWKAILLPKARHEIIRVHGMSKTIAPVDGLRVVRRSQEGKSLLVELYKEPVKAVVPIFKKEEPSKEIPTPVLS